MLSVGLCIEHVFIHGNKIKNDDLCCKTNDKAKTSVHTNEELGQIRMLFSAPEFTVVLR